MRKIIYLSLLAFLFLHTTYSQEISYQQVAEIIIGDHYTEEDVQIIKDDVENSKRQKTVSKLLKMEAYLSAKVDIGNRKVYKACADSYIEKQKNKDLIEKIYQEVQVLKKKYEQGRASNSQINELNKKVKKYNELIEAESAAIDNFKMCIITLREVRDDADEIIDTLYKSYLAKKANAVANND